MPRIEITYLPDQREGKFTVYEGSGKKAQAMLELDLNARETALLLDFLESAMVRINGTRLPESAVKPTVVIHEHEQPV